ncbi:unnamed protein product [Lupinus luteus]|uniref:Uncharacterized protein n=1 Tax=Lupinus luteus TaxID=3873 RepID=A0AAV1WUV1_LUPLU
MLQPLINFFVLMIKNLGMQMWTNKEYSLTDIILNFTGPFICKAFNNIIKNALLSEKKWGQQWQLDQGHLNVKGVVSRDHVRVKAAAVLFALRMASKMAIAIISDIDAFALSGATLSGQAGPLSKMGPTMAIGPRTSKCQRSRLKGPCESQGRCQNSGEN